MLKIFLFQLIFIILKINSLPQQNNWYNSNDEIFKIGIPNENIQYLNNLSTFDNIKEHAINMLKYMNRSVDPCTDFHGYACGNWKKYHEIPIDKESFNLFGILNDNLRQQLYEIFSTQNDNSNEIINTKLKTENIIQILFNSCNNIDKINERGTEPLLKFLKKFHGFPLLDGIEWSEENFNLEKILIQMTTYDMETFLRFTVSPDLAETNKTVIFFYNPNLGLESEDDYLKSYNKLRLEAYHEYIIEVLEILNVNRNESEKFAEEIIQLEVDLANITNIELIDFEDAFIVKTLNELIIEYPKLNWTFYLNEMFFKKFDNKLNETKITFLTGPTLDQLYDVLINTDKRILANYFNWIVVHQMITFLGTHFKTPIDKLHKILTGSQSDSINRELTCTTITNKNLGLAVGSIYIKKYFNENSKADISRIGEEIKNIFRENLYDEIWLDDETRLLAEHKVNKTRLALGYPDYMTNQTALNEYYEDLQLYSTDEYFENILAVRKFNMKKEAEKLKKDTDHGYWPVDSTIVNAFFDNPGNRILIPAGFLQPPIYHKDYPKALNYGAIGAFIGHELTHGFDSDGRSFDENGNLKNWWSNASLELFTEKEECFIDQYNKFSMYNKSLNGELSKKENVADNGGLQLSFKVYRNWLNTRGDKEKQSEIIFGLEFLSPEQLFFLSFAQSWCDYIRPEAIEARLSNDGHPPGNFRLVGALQNFNEFSKAYQCPENSYMNPTEKCKLW